MAEGIDRYEAQSIAESAADSAAGDAKRDISYELDRIRDELRSMEREVQAAQASRRAAVDEIWEAIGEIRQLASAGGHQHPELTGGAS